MKKDVEDFGNTICRRMLKNIHPKHIANAFLFWKFGHFFGEIKAKKI